MLVPRTGLEPVRPKRSLAPQASASTNSATSARGVKRKRNRTAGPEGCQGAGLRERARDGYPRAMPTLRRAARVFEVLARRQPDLTVLAEDVYKPHNLSAMLRSCDAVGIGTVHAVRPTGGVPTYQATSASGSAPG